MPQNRHILILDSGVGGLTIHEAIRGLLPEKPLVYFADHQYFPYGEKTEAWLVERMEHVVAQLMLQFPVEVVVVACNTASTVVLPSLRAKFSVPIVGVVPAIKPAAQKSQFLRIGLLATEGTISRSYTDQLVQDFASHCEVIPVASQELVELAERKMAGETVRPDSLRRICEPFLDGDKAKVDVVVLGCTHFPWLRDDLMDHVSSEIAWIDSASAIAQRVASLVSERQEMKRTGGYTFMSSSALSLSSSLSSYLQEKGFHEIINIEI